MSTGLSGGEELPVIRPTARVRREMRVKTVAGPPDGMRPESIYLRRFWVAVIGPGAVADLLRIIGAAQRKSTVLRPMYLHMLVQSGLATCDGETITVFNPVPLVPAHMRKRMPPALRREHSTWMRLRRRLA